MNHFPMLKKDKWLQRRQLFSLSPLFYPNFCVWSWRFYSTSVLLCKLVFILICCFRKISLRKEKMMVFSLLLYLFLLLFPLLYDTQPFSLPGGGGTAKCPYAFSVCWAACVYQLEKALNHLLRLSFTPRNYFHWNCWERDWERHRGQERKRETHSERERGVKA